MARSKKKAYDGRDYSNGAQKFKLLSDPTRLRILSALVNGATKIESMGLPTGMSQQAVGHHLALLRAANFIESQREGKELLHSLTDVGREFWGFAEKVLS